MARGRAELGQRENDPPQLRQPVPKRRALGRNARGERQYGNYGITYVHPGRESGQLRATAAVPFTDPVIGQFINLSSK